MMMKYTQTETGQRNVAVGDHAGYTARVVTGWDAKTDSFLVHVYIGKRGDGHQEAALFKKFDASDLSARDVQDAFAQGFALAQRAIDDIARL